MFKIYISKTNCSYLIFKDKNLSHPIVQPRPASFKVFKMYLKLISTISLEWFIYSMTLTANNKNFHLLPTFFILGSFTELFCTVLTTLPGRCNYLHPAKKKADQWMFRHLPRAQSEWPSWYSHGVQLTPKPRLPYSAALPLQLFWILVSTTICPFLHQFSWIIP